MASKTVTALGTFSTNGTSDATAPATLTADASGNVKIWLKHNQVATIGLSAASNGIAQIPLWKNATEKNTYTITETLESTDTFNPQEKYKVFIDTSTVESTTGSVTKTLAAIPEDPSDTTAADTQLFETSNKTKYTNNKEADPITGIFVNYWPFMLLIVLGLTGAYVFKKSSKKA